jgi:hypothetical protein
MRGWTSKPRTNFFMVFIWHQQLVELLFPEWKSLIHVKGEGQPYVCDSLFWEPHMHGVILF